MKHVFAVIVMIIGAVVYVLSSGSAGLIIGFFIMLLGLVLIIRAEEKADKTTDEI